MKKQILLALFAGFIILSSCRNKPKKHFTIDLNFTCTPLSYFDQLETVLLTNDGNGFTNLFEADRVYQKHLWKKNGHFYVDGVENGEYKLLLIECKLDNVLFTGYDRQLDFSENTKDTMVFDICIEPNMKIINQQ